MENERGEEILDSTPMALPVDFKRPIPLAERIRQLVRSEAFKAQLEASGDETFEEADDFEIPSDDTFDRTTPYEDNFDPERPGAIAREQELRAGAVQEIPIARRERARAIIEKNKKFSAGGAGDRRVDEVPERREVQDVGREDSDIAAGEGSKKP